MTHTLVIVSMFLAVMIGLTPGRELPREISSMGSDQMNKLLAGFTYLRRYGYYQVDTSKSNPTRPDRSTAIRRFQEFMGLPVTETLDEATMDMIDHPRCGVVDPVNLDDQTQYQSYTLLGGKWNKTDITYRLKGSIPGYPKKRLTAIVQEAFDIYTPHVPLTFTQVSVNTQSDIVFNFQSKEDDPDMDGLGKSVGWAYPPLANSEECGKIYIDADEDYTTEGPEGTPLLAVIAHEIGHALGLGHTSNFESIMAPCMPEYSPNFHLSQQDIDALSQLYGSGVSLGSELVNDNALCRMTSYDAVTVMDGFLYVFNGDRFWKFTTEGALLSPGDGSLISSQWPEVGGDVNVVFKNSLDHVVIVKGGKYYEYDVTGILLPWAPGSTRTMNLPKNAEAGYSIYRTSFFIRGGKLWYMDEVSRRVHPDSPKSIRKLWKVNVDHADSAFLLNGYLYILDGQNYMRLEASTAQLDESDSRNFARDFLGC